jgi:hypothetical protein
MTAPVCAIPAGSKTAPPNKPLSTLLGMSLGDLQAAIEASPGLVLVIRERLRQIRGEGWTPGHDDSEHQFGELTVAAVCYADTAIIQAEQLRKQGIDQPLPDCYIHSRWPWSRAWWKPRGVVRNLARAAALLVSEIDRMLRLFARLNSVVGEDDL